MEIMIPAKRRVLRVWIFLLLLPAFLFLTVEANAEGSLAESLMGIPVMGGSDDSSLDVCPQGVQTVQEFLRAWEEGDYRAMYDLLDNESKTNYPYEKARFDFQFLKFREYRVSAVRRRGNDFEVFLSYGDWKDGDKEMKKMMVSGRTFKVIMASSDSPFERSVETYF